MTNKNPENKIPPNPPLRVLKHDKLSNKIVIHQTRKNVIFKRIDDFIAYYSSGSTKHYKKYKFHKMVISDKNKKPQLYFFDIKEKIGNYYVIKLNCVFFNADKDLVIEKLKIFMDYIKTGRLVF